MRADICCPHAFHHTNGIACLDAGVNVMIEKPFGITIRAEPGADRRGRAERQDRGDRGERPPRAQPADGPLAAARPRTDRPAAPLLLAARRAGAIRRESANWHWRTEKALGGGGMVMDSGAHYCDTLRYLFGDVDSVYARVERLEERPHRKGNQPVPDEREDTWIATINFASGLTGVWSWSTSAPGHSFTHVVYYGTEGCLLDHGDVFHGPFSSAEVVLKDGSKRPMTELQEEYLASLSARGAACASSRTTGRRAWCWSATIS